MNRPIYLLVAHSRPDVVSGAELALADFVDKRDMRFVITMLVPGEGSLAAFYREKGYDVWVRRIQTKRRIAPGLHTLQSVLLARQLKEKGIDLVVCNTFAAAGRVATASRMVKLPYAIYVREYIRDKPLYRRMLDRADRVLVVSADLQNYLSAFTDPRKIRLAYDTIDAGPILKRVDAHRASGIRRLPFGSEHPVIGLIGRIARFKQQDLFIRAVPLVLAEVPQACFVIVGSAQESEKGYEAMVRELAVSLGVQDRVAFLGHRVDNVEIMSELNVACLTSTREPLGRVILEAHLAGVPVVVSDAGGPAEIVEQGVTGLLFPVTGPGAEEGLAEKITCLLKDDRLRRALATQASRRIGETYAGLKHVRQLEKYLEELVIRGG